MMQSCMSSPTQGVTVTCFSAFVFIHFIYMTTLFTLLYV